MKFERFSKNRFTGGIAVNIGMIKKSIASIHGGLDGLNPFFSDFIRDRIAIPVS